MGWERVDATRRGRRGYFARRAVVGPTWGPVRTPRAEGGAGTSRAGPRVGCGPGRGGEDVGPCGVRPRHARPSRVTEGVGDVGFHVGTVPKRNPASPNQRRVGARSTRAALGAWRPLSPTPCVHPMRVPRAAKLSPKKSEFFCHRRMPTAYIPVSGFARICAAPNKTRGIRRFGRRVRRVYFFFAAPLRARRLCGILMPSLTMEEDSDGMSGPGLTPGVSTTVRRSGKGQNKLTTK